MSRIHEGEVILKETFGSSLKERLYIRPPGQTSTVLVKWGETDSGIDWLLRIFLPQGYPDSVSKDYLSYQIWDTAQAFCSTIAGILATQEVLRGVGVGDVNATPLAATVTWILKDGCGHIGRILFAYSHGTYLDAYSKKWRMYADILNNAAMCIEIALPLFKVYTLFALCISTVMKAIVGVAGGATRVAMTQHHALTGNLADVSAKDSAQETAVNLVASVTALFILTTVGNSLFLFMLMMIFHVMFNYLAVRAVCLRTLNEPRFLLAIDQYLRHELIATPCEINRMEPIIFYQLGPCILDLKLCGFRIILGQSISKVFSETPQAEKLAKLSKIYEGRNYILVPNIQRRNMHVLLKERAAVDEVLCAYLHATLLAIIICAINDEPLPVFMNHSERPFAQVCRTLQSAEWSRYEARIPDCRFAYDASYDLMKYLDKIVQKEWPRVGAGLSATGWDLSKHLLVCDQWRLNSGKIDAVPISAEKMIDEGVQFESFTEQRKELQLSDIVEEPADSEILEEKFTIEPDQTSLMSSEYNLLDTTEKSPVSHTSKKSHVSQTTEISPVSHTTEKSPVSLATEKSPVSHTTEKSPVSLATEKSPVSHTTEKSPVSLATEKSPVSHTTEKSPVSLATEKSPVSHTTEKSPVSLAAEKSPVSLATEKSPVSLATDKSPVSLATENSLVSHTTENSPVSHTKPESIPSTDTK